MFSTQPSHANNSAPRHQVPAVRCDADGYVNPMSARERFDEHMSARCQSFHDPADALRFAPKKVVVPDLPEEVIDAALAPMWSRRKFSCRNPMAFDKFLSEVYPLDAAVVRDTRAPLLQGGANSRFDGRDPVDVYRRLGTDAWQNEASARMRIEGRGEPAIDRVPKTWGVDLGRSAWSAQSLAPGR